MTTITSQVSEREHHRYRSIEIRFSIISMLILRSNKSIYVDHLLNVN